MSEAGKNLPLILITNDDGIHANGLAGLIEVVKPYGNIVVVAPDCAQSGKSSALTTDKPLRVSLISEKENLKIYTCNGTPVDCIKLGLHQILNITPDFIASGINHGTNSSISTIYSGTMGAAFEGCINGIPSIGFSLTDYSWKADFTSAIHYSKIVFEKFMQNPVPKNTCLNVNIPTGGINEIKGIKVCRQTMGAWKEVFDKRTDPHNREYFWLTGDYHNYEPDAIDTDEWALENKYVSIVPVTIDFTSYSVLKFLKTNKYEI